MSYSSLVEEFSDLGIEVEDEDVLAQLAVLCQRYSIDSSKISCEYFAFNSKHKSKMGQPPTLELLNTFETEKLKTMKQGARRPLDPIEGAENLPDCPDLGGCGTPVRLVNAKRGALGVVTPDGHLAKKFVTAVGSPVVSLSVPTSPVSTTQGAGTRYTERNNKGEKVVRHNSEIGGEWEANVVPSISVVGKALQQPYKFMFERLRDRAAVLDETICRVGDRLVDKWDLVQDELLDISTTQPETAVGIGRVQCDSEGRLNSNSVVIHGSLDSSSGSSVPLDLSQVSSYSLFPGMVAAMDCTNPNGSKLVASKIYEGPSLPLANLSLADNSILSMLVAAGPFTTSDSIGLEPLQDILQIIKDTKPSVAVLMGPFLDMKNSAVCGSAEDFDTQWVKMVTLMAKELEGLTTELIMVPSSRDAVGYPVYPQPPFPASSLYLPTMRCVSDPCVLDVAGVTVALTSADILFHLGKEEISFPPRSGDRMSRLSSHLIHQGNMYPLYPPSEELNVDYESLEQYALLDKAPHLMILPSDLTHFVRDLTGTTVLNPGRLTKGTGPGTFSLVKMRKGEGDKLETMIEIIRI